MPIFCDSSGTSGAGRPRMSTPCSSRSIEIAASFLEQARLAKRERLKAIESIGKYAVTAPARYAAENFGLDCLDAVPASLLRKGALPEDFLKKRWPQILANTGKR